MGTKQPGQRLGHVAAGKGAAGCQEASRASPTYSVPCREGVNENPAGYPQGAWRFFTENTDKSEDMITWKCMGGLPELQM